MNIDSHKSLTTRIEPSQLRRCSSIPALTILVACAPISSYDEEGLKAFHMNVGRLYIEGHALFKIIVGDDFNTKMSNRNFRQIYFYEFKLGWTAAQTARNINEEDYVNDNTDEEHDRLFEHLRDCVRKTESLKDVKKRPSSKTLELIRAACNNQLTSELAKLCREAIKEDLKERRAAVLTETAEAARRSFVNYETKMASLRRPYGTVTVSRRAMEKAIYDFHSDLFDSHVCRPT
ncbi:hypothetical protein V3C99_006248, partial [Haemonchus contortus]